MPITISLSQNGLFTGAVSQAERLSQVRAIINRINIPPLAPDESDITMDEIVQECRHARQELYREQVNTEEFRQVEHG